MLRRSDWGVPLLRNGRLGTKVKFAAASLHRPVFDTRTMPSKKAARMGTKAKPLSVGRWQLCFLWL